MYADAVYSGIAVVARVESEVDYRVAEGIVIVLVEGAAEDVGKMGRDLDVRR